MKINNNAAGLNQLENKKSSKTDLASRIEESRANSKSAKSSGLTGGSKVDVSEKALLMQKATEIAKKSDDMDEAKIARFQKLIDEGKYNVDASAVADKLVDEHLLMP